MVHWRTLFRGWLVFLAALGSLESVAPAVPQSFGSICLTAGQERGRCVPVKRCDSIMATLRKKVHTNEDIQFVDESECGRTADGKALVCCVQSAPLPGAVDRKQNVSAGVRSSVGQMGQITPAGIGASAWPVCGAQPGAREIPTEEGVSQNIGFHPWSVLLHYGSRPHETNFSCSGTLISAKYVLTSASCVADVKLWPNLTAKLGEYDLESTVDCLPSIIDEDFICADPSYDVKVAQVLLHEGFGGGRNDIALLRLSQPVELTEWVAPICLPETPVLKETGSFHAASWNQNTCGEKSSRHKVLTSYGVATQAGCRRHLPSGNTGAAYNVLCVTSTSRQPFVDSGGALTVTKTIADDRESRSVHELAGVLSSMSNCANYDGVLVYTKVGLHLDWIRGKLGEPSDGGQSDEVTENPQS